MAVSSSALSVAALSVRDGGSPAAARAIAVRARIVPDEPTATSKPWASTSLANGGEGRAHEGAARAHGARVEALAGKKRSVRRTAPSLKLRDASTSPR